MLEVRVSRKIIEAQGVCSFELVPLDQAELPPFTAGAHIDVHLGPALTRQYSLCNPPHERHRYLIAVLEEPASRGGSKHLHQRIEEGTQLSVGLPRNLFELDLTAERYLLLAGGIGITPLLAMAHVLEAAGKPFELHYCGRDLGRLAFVDPLKASTLAHHLHVHVDNGPPAQRLDAQRVLATPQPGDQLYTCGPAGFMAFVEASAKACGWADHQIHREDFAAASQGQAGDAPFDIHLARSGKVLEVPCDETVLEVLLRNGIDVDSSCEQGICGACITPLLEGEPDHRDQFMTAAEHAANDRFAVCCSRARSARLVLDL